MSVRPERVGAMLREALSNQFQRSMPEYLDGMITVVSVKMTSDLRIAKIYVSIYRSQTDPELLIKRMNTHTAEIRKELASHVSMRFMPELRFYRDDTLDAAERIDKLLEAVRKEDEAKGLRRPDEDRPADHTPDTGDDGEGNNGERDNGEGDDSPR
jgi:ribosome-binding factor A